MRSRRKIKRKKKIKDVRGLVLGLIGLILIVGVGLRELATSKLGRGKGKLNILFIGKDQPGVIMSVDSVGERISWLNFPAESLIKSRSIGFYQVGKLVDLAKYEKDPAKFIVAKFQGFLKIPIEAYCLVDDKTSLSGEGKGSWLWHCQKTNLNWGDKLRLSFWLNQYTQTNMGMKRWEREAIIKRKEERLTYDNLRLEEFVKDRFFDWLVAKEGIDIAVIDATGASEGKDLATLVENLGTHVIVVKKWPKVESNSEIVVANKALLKSLTLKKLKEILGISKIRVGDTSEYRSDLVLIGGKDLSSLF